MELKYHTKKKRKFINENLYCGDKLKDGGKE